MRVLIVGSGVQGRKRRAVAGTEAVGVVDPNVDSADFRKLEDVPQDLYDAAILCTPDTPKLGLIRYALDNGKHVMVEKPLLGDEQALRGVADRAAADGLICYTAYNHRFEPHFMRMRDVIASGRLGRIYLCRMFYGNGTARDVRDSVWRDSGSGVMPDLGSHLLDTASFWFGDAVGTPRLHWAERFENRAFDHVAFGSRGAIRIEFEATLLSWRNHFTCDVFAENGTAHISSLCKWGPSTFTLRERVLPSGKPPEDSVTLVQSDPTWELEYEHFKSICTARRGSNTDQDLKISRWLAGLAAEAEAKDAACAR